MSRPRAIGFASIVLGGALLGTGFAASVPPPAPTSPGSASGTFSIDGKSVELHYAYAMAQPNTFDEKKTDTAILLTEKPLPDSAFAGLKDLESAGRGTVRNSVLFVLGEDGQARREVVHHEALGDASLQMSGMTHADVKVTAKAVDRIEGSVQTSGVEDFMKHKYQIQVKFQAVIRQAYRDPPPPDAKTGQRLPRGGGEPGKAYLALQDAIRRKDIETVKKLKPADAPDMSDDDLKKGLEFMAAMMPPKIAIDNGYVAGDTAVLYVSGMLEKEKQYGTVNMKKSGGVWRPAGEKWSNTPPSK